MFIRKPKFTYFGESVLEIGEHIVITKTPLNRFKSLSKSLCDIYSGRKNGHSENKNIIGTFQNIVPVKVKQYVDNNGNVVAPYFGDPVEESVKTR